MKKIGMFACISALAMLGGCAGIVPHEAQYTNSQTYPESHSAVWEKVLSMSAHNAMIVSPDNANGIINARREIVNPRADPVFDWADCGWSGVFARPLTQRIDVHYLVQDDSRGTKVIINTEFRELRLNVVNQKAAWVSCASTGVLEEELLDALWGV